MGFRNVSVSLVKLCSSDRPLSCLILFVPFVSPSFAIKRSSSAGVCQLKQKCGCGTLSSSLYYVGPKTARCIIDLLTLVKLSTNPGLTIFIPSAKVLLLSRRGLRRQRNATQETGPVCAWLLLHDRAQWF